MNVLLRIVQFFFGCTVFAVCEVENHAVIGVQQCQLRAYHRGGHRFPSPWVVAA